MDESSLHPEMLLLAAERLGQTIRPQASALDQQSKANFAAFEQVSHLRLGALRVPLAQGGPAAPCRN